jgi:hypothetical protein
VTLKLSNLALAILLASISSTASQNAPAPVVLERGPHHRVIEFRSFFINEHGEEVVRLKVLALAMAWADSGGVGNGYE